MRALKYVDLLDCAVNALKHNRKVVIFTRGIEEDKVKKDISFFWLDDFKGGNATTLNPPKDELCAKAWEVIKTFPLTIITDENPKEILFSKQWSDYEVFIVADNEDEMVHEFVRRIEDDQQEEDVVAWFVRNFDKRDSGYCMHLGARLYSKDYDKFLHYIFSPRALEILSNSAYQDGYKTAAEVMFWEAICLREESSSKEWYVQVLKDSAGYGDLIAKAILLAAHIEEEFDHALSDCYEYSFYNLDHDRFKDLLVKNRDDSRTIARLIFRRIEFWAHSNRQSDIYYLEKEIKSICRITKRTLGAFVDDKRRNALWYLIHAAISKHESRNFTGFEEQNLVKLLIKYGCDPYAKDIYGIGWSSVISALRNIRYYEYKKKSREERFQEVI